MVVESCEYGGAPRFASVSAVSCLGDASTQRSEEVMFMAMHGHKRPPGAYARGLFAVDRIGGETFKDSCLFGKTERNDWSLAIALLVAAMLRPLGGGVGSNQWRNG